MVEAVTAIVQLVGLAFASSTALYQTIKSFKNSSTSLRHLENEAYLLSHALKSLQAIVDHSDSDFTQLELPLKICGQACREFEQLILKVAPSRVEERQTFRGWLKLQYRGEDIKTFRETLEVYRSIVCISIGDANLGTLVVTKKVLQEYKDMITGTTERLEERLERLDNDLDTVSASETPVPHSFPASASDRPIQQERNSTKQCLVICAQVSQHIANVHTGVIESLSIPTDANVAPVTTLIGLISVRHATSEALKTSISTMNRTASSLQRRLELLDSVSSRGSSSGDASISREALFEKLTRLARTKQQELDYKSSVVDLLKLLDLHSSLDFRKRLAVELEVQVGLPGQHKHNAALHEAMIKQLCQCGGQVPAQILRVCAEHEMVSAATESIDKPAHYSPYMRNMRNKNFVGREAELRSLEALFNDDNTRQIVILGSGGIGKTAIALELAYVVKHYRKDYSVFWMPALSMEAFRQACVDIVSELHLLQEDDKEDTREVLRRYLESASSGKWFLIVDDANDRNMFSGVGEESGVIDYLPKLGNGKILYTTRYQDVAIDLAGENVVELGKWQRDDASYYLNNVLIDKDIKDDGIETKLLDELADHPLAITQAAAYINKNKITIARYLQDLSGHDNSDLESVQSIDVAPSLTSGTTLSDSHQIARTAAEEFAEVLIQDGAMHPLYSIGIARAGSDKFKRNFVRLLTKFAVDLKAEATTTIQVEAAQLVRSRANFITYLVANSVRSQEISTQLQSVISTSDKRSDLERYLQQQQLVENRQSLVIDPQEADVEEHVEEEDELGEPDGPRFINLHEAKQFIVESKAFEKLRENVSEFILPPTRVTEVKPQARNITMDTNTRLCRLHWTCSCGHAHYDDFVEIVPASINRLVELLRQNGVKSRLEVRQNHSSYLNWRRWYLLSRNAMVHLVGPVVRALRRSIMQSSALSFMSAYDSAFGQGTPPTVIQSWWPTVQTVNTVENFASPSSSPSMPTQAAVLQHQQMSLGLRNDYILICSDKKGWLTAREDLNISHTKSDRELFRQFRNSLYRDKSWINRCLSLKTIQRISFVKFALRPNQEIDQVQLDQIPPEAEAHYDFHERSPDYIPPIGNNYLMHRFSNISHCQDSTFCLTQIPKRLGGRPQYGSPPDHSTAWGLYFQEGLDETRMYLYFIIASVLSLTFGSIWAEMRSIQDGFAIASYILALEVLTISTAQLAVVLDWI